MNLHVRRYQRHYHSTGHIWQGRFKAFPIEHDEHLRVVLRYVERNPLRAALVEHAQDWPWSSLHHLAKATAPRWLDPGPAPRGQGWVEEVNRIEEDAQLARLRACLVRGTPFGSESWTGPAAESLGVQSHTPAPGPPEEDARLVLGPAPLGPQPRWNGPEAIIPGSIRVAPRESVFEPPPNNDYLWRRAEVNESRLGPPPDRGFRGAPSLRPGAVAKGDDSDDDDVLARQARRESIEQLEIDGAPVDGGEGPVSGELIQAWDDRRRRRPAGGGGGGDRGDAGGGRHADAGASGRRAGGPARPAGAA